jgi:hypothetical protein
MTVTDYCLLLTVILLMLICWSLIRQLVRSEKSAQSWRDMYFNTRNEAQELFEENIELRASSKQK